MEKLKRKLEALGYSNVDSIPDSAFPLIDRVFSDLVQTTESLQALVPKHERLSEDLVNAQNQVQPLKRENARLSRENNNLRAEALRQSEAFEESAKKLKETIRSLDTQLSDTKFLNTQLVVKCRNLEKECQSRKEKLQDFLVKQGLAEGRDITASMKPKMELSSSLGASLGRTQPTSAAAAHSIDVMKLADRKMEELNKLTTALQHENSTLAEKVRDLEAKIESRESEITRLSRLVEGRTTSGIIPPGAELSGSGVGSGKSALNPQIPVDEANQKMISQLVQQVEFLHSQLAMAETRESREKSLQDRVGQLMMEIERLQNELSDQQAITSSERQEKVVAQGRLEDAARDADQLMTKVQQLRMENQSLNEKLTECTLEIRRLNTALTTTKRESDAAVGLNSQLQTLTAQLRMVQGELEDRSLAIEKLKAEKERVEAEWRLTAGDLEEANGKLAALRNENQMLHDELTQRTIEMRKISSEGASVKRERDHFSSLQPLINDLQEQLRKARAEVGEKDEECRQARLERQRVESVLAETSKETRELAANLSEVSRERDYLGDMMHMFEQQLSTIQSSIRTLTVERDGLKEQYDKLLAELDKRSDAERAASGESTKLTSALRRAQLEIETRENQIKNLMRESEDARANADKATQEATLNKRLSEQLQAQCAALTDQLSIANRQIEQMRDQLMRSDVSTESEREKLKGLRGELEELKNTLAQRDDECRQLKTLLTQLDAARDELASQVQSARKQADGLARDFRRAREEGDVLRAEITQKTKECERHLSALSELDARRDVLQHQLDIKTEELERAISSNRTFEQALQQAQHGADDAQRHSEMQLRETRDREKQVATLRAQAAQLSDELERTRSNILFYEEKVRSLESDLAAVTRENQHINGELAAALAQKERLKVEVQDAVAKAANYGHNAASKQQEIDDLLKSYRALADENSGLRGALEQSDKRTTDTAAQLMLREHDIAHLSERLRITEDESRRLLTELHSMDTSGQQLAKSLAQTQRALDEKEAENQSLIRDLTAAKQANQTTEMSRNSAQRDVASAVQEIDRLKSQVQSWSDECATLTQQLKSEKSVVKDLETLISQLRAKEFRSESLQRDAADEQRLLRDRLNKAIEERDSLNRDLILAKQTCQSLESDVQRLSGAEQDAASQRDTLMFEVKTLRARIEETQRTVEHQYEVIQGLDEERLKSKTSVARLESQLDSLSREKSDVDRDLANTRENRAMLEDKWTQVRNENAALQQTLDDLRRQLGNTEKQVAREASALAQTRDRELSLSEQINRLQDNLATSSATCEQLRLENEGLQIRLSELRQENERTQGVIVRMEADRDSLRKEYTALVQSERRLQEMVRRIDEDRDQVRKLYRKQLEDQLQRSSSSSSAASLLRASTDMRIQQAFQENSS